MGGDKILRRIIISFTKQMHSKLSVAKNNSSAIPKLVSIHIKKLFICMN